jgi:hypothetical protein
MEWRRLAAIICSEDSNTRSETHLEVNVGQLVCCGTGVAKVNVSHFEKLLCRRADTLQTTRFRELEIRGGELKVMLGLRLLLDKVLLV